MTLPAKKRLFRKLYKNTPRLFKCFNTFIPSKLRSAHQNLRVHDICTLLALLAAIWQSHLPSRSQLLRFWLCVWSMAFWKKLSAEELHPLFLRHAVQRVLRYLDNRSRTMEISVSELLSWKNKMMKNKIEHFSMKLAHCSLQLSSNLKWCGCFRKLCNNFKITIVK